MSRELMEERIVQLKEVVDGIRNEELDDDEATELAASAASLVGRLLIGIEYQLSRIVAGL